MGLFRRKERSSAAAVAEPEAPVRPEIREARELEANGKVFEGITVLTEANRAGREVELEREIIAMRHRAGADMVEAKPDIPGFPEPADGYEFEVVDRIPVLSVAELTPEILRAAILEYGCLKVTGVMDPETAAGLAEDIEKTFDIRETMAEFKPVDPTAYYEKFDPRPPFEVTLGERSFVAVAAGVLAADSPRMFFKMVDSFERSGIREVIEGYLGERAVISAQKCTLRKVDPSMAGGWHQDGKFLGDVRALNVWVALSRCGDVAPSMDVVPRRVDEILASGVREGDLEIQIAPDLAEEAAGEIGIVRPIFDPGDVLLFDDLFVHQTGSDPAMPNPRYAIESWFFGPSAFPVEYAPLAF